MTRKAREDDELQSAEALVERLGPHPSTSIGLDLEAGGSERDLGRWLVLSILLGGRTTESAARDAFSRLAGEGLADPSTLGRSDGAAVAACLELGGLHKSEATAAVLIRVASNLLAQYEGSLERLASRADDLEGLAHGLSRLGAGFGKAAVFRFLTPLRSRWSAAGDLPATAAVHAAATDLGIVSEAQDEEGTPAALAHWLARNESGSADVALPDLEAALDRLGRASCLRERRERCPLAESCPRLALEGS